MQLQANACNAHKTFFLACSVVFGLQILPSFMLLLQVGFVPVRF